MPDQIKLIVTIQLGPNGEALSSHDFADYDDAVTAGMWPSGGLRHIAHGLLLEAVRRESFVSILAKTTATPEYLEQYRTADPDERKVIEEVLNQKVQAILLKNLQAMTIPSIKEAFQMILGRLPLGEKKVE